MTISQVSDGVTVRRWSGQEQGQDALNQGMRQWERQWESELARQSVCKKVSQGSADKTVDEHGSPLSPDGMTFSPKAEAMPLSARSVVAEEPVKGDAVFSGPVAWATTAKMARSDIPPIMPTPAVQPVTPPVDSAARSDNLLILNDGVEAALPLETAVRYWLKPSHVVVYEENNQVKVWVRDSRLSAEGASNLLAKLGQQLRLRGAHLAQLTINGTVVRAPEAGLPPPFNAAQ